MKLHIAVAVVVLDVVVILDDVVVVMLDVVVVLDAVFVDVVVVALVEQLQPWLRKIKASSN